MVFWDAVASAGPYANNLHFAATDNHTNTSSLKFFTSRMLFLTPSQQCQSTEGNIVLQFSCNDIVTCDCSAIVDIEAVEKDCLE